MTADYQPSLLSESDLRAADLSWAYNRPVASTMPLAELQSWKQRVRQYQAAVQAAPQAEQGSLFDLATHPSPGSAIDPFTLPLKMLNSGGGNFKNRGCQPFILWWTMTQIYCSMWAKPSSRTSAGRAFTIASDTSSII
jgi:hypothetical protein